MSESESLARIPYEQSRLFRVRHSAAHVLAEAVLDLFPGTKTAIGPPTEDGFYYDFDVPGGLAADHLPAIEQRMRELLRRSSPFSYREISEQEARTFFANQPYKLELIDGILREGLDEHGTASVQPPVLSTYRSGSFEDLCRGPHVKTTAEIDPDALKLVRVAGAYWRGDENRPMLQRVYGTVWETPDQLQHHLWQIEEAKKRDHRKIGEELDLFAFTPEIGRGLPLWLPKGAVIREELERWAKETERKWGYQRVFTPHLARGELYNISGHLPYYEEDLYRPIDIEGDLYYLKPMNCPHHHMVYKARPHSYRELPIRYAEYGTVYRYESSGQLHGLMRARGFTQNDAHIYCAPDDAQREFVDVMRLHRYYYARLGLADYHMVLALRDPKNSAKYHGDDEMWHRAEEITRQAMDESGIAYVEDVGGAAHYGPKVDFIIRAVTGKEFAASTNQVDLYMPQRFDLTYTDASGGSRHVVLLHRAPLGSHERFVAFLVEHFGGAFPTWLAPVQVKVIPVADRNVEYGRRIVQHLNEMDLRVELDDGNERMQAKIRKAQLGKIPYMLIVGNREVQSDLVSVRLRSGEDLGVRSVKEFMSLVGAVVKTRSLSLLEPAPE